MTVISHQHKFIFVRPYKVAGTSISICLGNLCEGNDIFCLAPNDRAYCPGIDDDDFGAVAVLNEHIFANLKIKEGRVSGHISPWQIRRMVGGSLWGEYFKFTVIRNPWDWFISLYWWRRNRWLDRQVQSVRATAPKAPIYYARRHWRHTLDRYRAGQGISQESVERALRRKWFEEYMARWPRFYFLDGMPYADCYLRFEHLQEDFDRMCHRLGLPGGVLLRTKSRVRPKGVDYRDYYTDWSRDYIGRRFREIISNFGYSF